MSNIDKHAVQTVADLKAGYTLGHADVAILNELARIALASLEAEPAIHRWRRVTFEPYGPYPWHYGNFIGFSKPVDGIEDEYYYAAPPAPVSVPAAMEMDDDFDSAFEHGKAVGWNAYRAAMLQGAEPVTTAYKLRDAVEIIRNSGIEIDSGKIQAERDSLNSPVIPDCSCRTCRPVTFSDSRFVVCPECGNKRCPHANDHRNACTGSNEPGQEGSAYPAAPQQEVK
nr:MAG TPA: rubredoxin-like protein [Caudoviricetes sp.]